MKKLILIFLLCRLQPAIAEEGIRFFKGTFSEALAQSKEQHKLIFIDCFTTWCGPCKWMAANVFTDQAVAEMYNKYFICLAIDMEKSEGITLAKKYAVRNYPTFLYIDQSGAQVHRSVGTASTGDFMGIAGKAMDPVHNLASMKSRYDSGNREPDLLLNYASSLREAYDMNYQSVADEYFKTLPEKELVEEKNWHAILEFTPNINSYTYGAMSKMLPEFYVRYGKDSVNNVLDRLAIESISFARQQNDSLLLLKAITKLKTSNNKESMKEGLSEELSYYKGNKNYTRYTELANNYVNNYFLDDPQMLNNVCWTYFQHISDKAQLAEAEKWIAHSVTLEDKYYNTDTYANILHKLGKRKEAIQMTNHSIDLAKKEGEDSSSTQELLDALQKGD